MYQTRYSHPKSDIAKACEVTDFNEGMGNGETAHILQREQVWSKADSRGKGIAHIPGLQGGDWAAWLCLCDNWGAMGLSHALLVYGVSLGFLKMPLLSVDSPPGTSCEK